MTRWQLGLIGGALSCVSCHAHEQVKPEAHSASSGVLAPAGACDHSGPSSLPMPRGRAVSFHAELARISAVRGLAAGGDLRGLVVDREELLAHVERAVDLETPESAMRGTGALLAGLGLVPAEFDYKATFLTLLEEQLAGLYDPRLRAMLIRAGLTKNERDGTLTHELVHALQDQNFDVLDVVTWSPDDTDRSGALSALAEGDATSATLDVTAGEGANALSFPPGFIEDRFREDSSGPEVPTIIRRSLKASYIDGVTFVHALRRRGGWDEVNRVWKNPPETSEQMLHLDKYDAREAAQNVPVPAAPASGHWTLLLHDIWGEQNLRLVFEEWMSLKDATAAASGWGGDRIVAYDAAGQVAIAWQIVADDDHAAARMLEAFSKGVDPLSPAAGGASAKADVCGSRANGHAVWAVGRKGKHVVLASSPFKSSESIAVRCEIARGYLSTHLVTIAPG